MLKKITLSIHLIVFSLFFIANALFAETSICIIIPAYNEADRIKPTLEAYAQFFSTKPEKTTFLVVANNCSDNTVEVVKTVAQDYCNIELLDLKPGGKGFAIKQGFLWALQHCFDLIGFVDADMATQPQHYYDLVLAAKDCDGAIASRYAKGAHVWPTRPWLKKIGGKFYNWMLRSRFGFSYKDTQCGAKIFTNDTIAKVAPYMEEKGWAFDLELLYLCKLEGKNIAEVATTWSDQPGSHLTISSKLIKEFLNSPTRIKQRHTTHRKNLLQAKKQNFKKIKKSKIDCSC